MIITFQKSIITFFQELVSFVPAEFWVFSARYIPWFFLGVVIIFMMHQTISGILQGKDGYVRRVIFTLSTVSIVAFIAQLILKTLIIHERPFLQGVYSFYEYGSFESFPSGHALVFMAIAVSVYFLNRKLGLILIVSAIFIGFARMIVGIHWPIDIFAGWILGWLAGKMSYLIYKKKR